nr:unnamed protein product [Digitaria exilis]
MAYASPGTDTSTDLDTDEKNQMAYVEQLENSRLKLTHLEQELQRARQQGIFIPSPGDQLHPTRENALDYARWQEDHNKQIDELRAALNAHAGDDDLRRIIDSIVAHYGEAFRLNGIAAKADAVHVLSAMWKTPVERCFLWLGEFRPSELLKLLASHLEPLTEQQLASLCNLQQSSQQSEEDLSQGVKSLQQSVVEILASGSLCPAGSSGNAANCSGQMAVAIGKLGTLQNFLQEVHLL